MQDAIARVQTLEEEGRITGVMDDRGKFIHISREEMAAVAEFIRARGRIAIGELAAKSSSFIDLEQRCACCQRSSPPLPECLLKLMLPDVRVEKWSGNGCVRTRQELHAPL
jgi:hypothetical protein